MEDNNAEIPDSAAMPEKAECSLEKDESNTEFDIKSENVNNDNLDDRAHSASIPGDTVPSEMGVRNIKDIHTISGMDNTAINILRIKSPVNFR